MTTLHPFPPSRFAPESIPLRRLLVWMVVNALLVVGVLWMKPAHAPSPPAAPPRMAASPSTAQLPEPPPAGPAAPMALPEPPRVERTTESLEVFAAVAVDGRLFALEARPTVGAAHTRASLPSTSLLLPGGGALLVTARPSARSELASDTWTVIADEGTCLTQVGRAVELSVLTDDSVAQTTRIPARELVGCSASLGTTDRALAVRGAHPEARFDYVDPCSDEASPPSARMDRDGFDTEGRALLPEHELVLMRSAGDDAGLRVLDVQGTSSSLLVDEPISPLWQTGVVGPPSDC